MSRRLLLALLAPAAALALAACATVRPDATGSPVPTPPSSAPVTSATPTPTPSSASPTPSATPTDDEGASLLLRGDGLANFDFGAKQLAVMELLEDQLGDPDESSQGVLCELDDSSPWAQTIVYGGLWVQFEAKDGKKSSPRTLGAWGFQLSQEFAEPLEMADGVPLDLSFKQLKARYPEGKLRDIGFGDGTRMFTLPNKIRFIGASRPDLVSAGSFSTCE
jgi:hypothetical protein